MLITEGKRYIEESSTRSWKLDFGYSKVLETNSKNICKIEDRMKHSVAMEAKKRQSKSIKCKQGEKEKVRERYKERKVEKNRD